METRSKINPNELKKWGQAKDFLKVDVTNKLVTSASDICFSHFSFKTTFPLAQKSHYHQMPSERPLGSTSVKHRFRLKSALVGLQCVNVTSVACAMS